MISYPNIDPIAIQLGPLAVRWYGLMYLAGFASAYALIRKLIAQRHLDLSSERIADLLFACVLGVVLGGRLGYVVFYNASFYFHQPLKVFYLWEGGMSFHGGLLGVVVASSLFCRKHRLPMGQIGDILVISACFGLFFGRVGNFINAELWGRVTDVPWGIVFPGAGPLPRHPSQLYEAVLEGPVLFIVLYWLFRRKLKPWSVFFSFISCYALFRFIIEFFRQPDAHLGVLSFGLTMGQALSIPMIFLGVIGVILLNRQRGLNV